MTKFGWACLGFSGAFGATSFFTNSPFLIAALVAMILISWVYAVVDWLDARNPAMKIDDREWQKIQKRPRY